MSTTIGSVDPYKLAAQQQTLHGKCPVAVMERAKQLLADEQGELVYAINFAFDPEHLCVISGEFNGELTLCCQRCIQTFQHPVHCEFAISPITGDNVAKDLPYEPALLVEGKLDLLQLLEDEVILALPQVPMHDLADCVAADRTQDDEQVQEVSSPFQVLQRLKLKEDK